MAELRINRALALAGVASRRGAEELVRAGRVRLNGEVVATLGVRVDPKRDKLTLDGKPLKLAASAYYLFYKPRGLITTLNDERGRACLGDICRELAGVPRPVGRLDRESEGLLLLTNDGELAHRLTHPRYGVLKAYEVVIEPRLSDKAARAMIAGVALAPVPEETPRTAATPAKFEGVQLLRNAAEPQAAGGRSTLRVNVAEGRHHLIRRVCDALGFSVKRLKRVQLGPLKLGSLKPGEQRSLTGDEIYQLRHLTGLK